MNTILVVDDSAIDRTIMGRIIEKETGAKVAYAENGRTALVAMEDGQFDVVVTDIKMPEMNGLELLLEIKEKWPQVPVIIKTGHGTEEIAVKALHDGAASYVPYSALSGMLGKTVEEVLAATQQDRTEADFYNEMTSASFTFSLTDLSSSESLVKYLTKPLIETQLCDETVRRRIRIALREALKNAFERGNMELSSDLLECGQQEYFALLKDRCDQPPYKDRRIFVEASIAPDQARYVIRDEGPGFDTAILADPTDPDNVSKPHGRGSLLMQAFMDEVIYNDVGNEVTLLKYRRSH